MFYDKSLKYTAVGKYKVTHNIKPHLLICSKNKEENNNNKGNDGLERRADKDDYFRG
jgi:hypothetical protein